MENKRLRIPYFLACAIPYPFLAMWEDAAFGTLWCYGLMILALVLLCRTAIRRGLAKLLFAGNTCSFLLSLLCTALFQTEKWLWYFKPLSPFQMVVFLSAVITLLELAALWMAARKENSL